MTWSPFRLGAGPGAWEPEREAAPLAGPAVDVDAATVGLGDVPHQGEPTPLPRRPWVSLRPTR